MENNPTFRMPFCWLENERNLSKVSFFLIKILPASVAWLSSLFIVSFPIFDPDLYWHLANGRAMVASRQIINEDIMSYTHYGMDFVNHEWLSQALFYLLWDNLGPSGLFAFKLFLSSLIVFFIYRSVLVMGGTQWIAAQLGVIAVLAGLQRYHIRPELFTLLNMAILGYILHRNRQNPNCSKCLWILPFLFVVWDWLHGAVIGVAYFSLFFAGENLKTVFPVFGKKAGLRNLNICYFLTMATVVLSPYGVRSYEHFMVLVSGNQGADRIFELQPMWQIAGGFLTFKFLFILALVLIILSRRSFDITEASLVLFFGFGALQYNRLVGVAAIVFVPVIGRCLSAFFSGNSGSATKRISTVGMVLAMVITVVVGFNEKIVKMAGSFSPHGTYILPSETAFGFSLNELLTPAGSTRFIQDMGLKGNMYNNANLGGYLSFYLAPVRPIFQYNMPPIFGDTTRYVKNPRELEQWHVNYALAGSAGELTRLFPSTHWAWVYSDYVSTLVVRRTPQNQALIDEYEIQYFSPEQSLVDYHALVANSRVYPRLAFEMGVYLAYMKDDRIAERWGQMLLRHPDLLDIPSIQEVFIKAVERNNGIRQTLMR